MSKGSVIFICIHNSARSQFAEANLKKFGSDLFDRVESAGLESGKLNPLVVQAMAEKGIDISVNGTKEAMEFVRNGTHFDYVITVCDQANAERCPIFPGFNTKLRWSFRDPSRLTDTDEAKLIQIRQIRDEIAETVQNWAETIRIKSS